MNILFVEDNKMISKGVCYSLEQNGYAVTLCENFESALKCADESFDLMIIDITLPDGNGFELYQRIKKLQNAPAVFLTAVDDEDSIVKAFDLGADDYITKPFSMRELLARIKRLTKNTSSTARFGDIEINFDEKAVYKSGTAVELTALEYKIFSMLAKNPSQTIPRERILEKIWDITDNYVNDNTLTVYINRIRQKLDTDIIKTVKGLGYRLEQK